MKCPIPTNQTFNNLNNFIDMTEYTKICNEFNFDLNSDFRLKLDAAAPHTSEPAPARDSRDQLVF